MQFLKCLNHERLFEFVTIPAEIGVVRKSYVTLHSMTCSDCRDKIESIRKQWSHYFKPEPEITSSLMNVYSRLQNDETLILKGWKFDELRPRSQGWVASGWLFRGGIAAGLAAIGAVIMVSQIKTNESPRTAFSASMIPYAQIRLEDKNRIQVQYVKPELLGSMEFQTSNIPTQNVSTGTFR